MFFRITEIVIDTEPDATADCAPLKTAAAILTELAEAAARADADAHANHQPPQDIHA